MNMAVRLTVRSPDLVGRVRGCSMWDDPMPLSWTRRGDLLALAALLFLSALVIANRVVFDGWLARHDIITFFLPGYTFLGEQLRAFDIPGWSPYFFGGQPFAGDPQSGWMFLPTMLTFPLFEPGTAFKITVALALLIAGFATYAFARVVGLRPVPSLMAAVVFEFGPLLYHTTDCCTIRAQLQIWIPVSLLGVELALRSLTWRGRVAAWFLAGFGISQMFAGWLGQGSLDGILVVGSYLGYRALL